MRKWIPWAVVTGVVAAALVVVAGPRLLTTETRIEPQVVRLLGSGGDPLVLMVGFRWIEEGFCDGQFTVEAVETTTTVTIGTVVSRERDGMMCAGLGTVDEMAWVDVNLRAPLGTRSAVRSSDGVTLALRPS
ncbi:hypothetical protein Aab01nite_11680 [Paractinoplanes abujensis]|uniref:Uncharacterized protein n=1 Tax=Paractinoplanes abujensis TaxID=882441 RepID=A0A7W7CPS7_9ACTN|nr:hypothetical protein [Actinoplanes abujensis]MBB4691008.1 hypothetical protein [Actinoplanes abujensis]GID17578.1 hypothetical protein Aab01nite_11680 [Actinoplanes abujensis]